MIYRRLMAILIATTLSLGTAVVPCLASLALVSDQAAETLSRAADSAPVPHETPQRPLVLENQSAIGNTVSGSSMPPGSSAASVLDTSPVCHIQLENAQRLYLLEFLWTPPAPVGRLLRPA